jgi:pyruvate dehydrogenase E1 component alpha subunit
VTSKSKKTSTRSSSAKSDSCESDVSGVAQAAINKKLTKEDKINLYRNMVRIREFEERSQQAYTQGKIGGFLHLYSGQESVAVGTVSLMGENDHVITAYRDHGHALAVGMSMNECMAELYGKFTGCSKGKGGSMHYFAPDKRFWGGHGIVGGQTPLGAGIAFYLKYHQIKGCCLCFLGDGAVNQGAFLETLNLVSLWDIPVVFIIENNRYSMGTSQKRSSAGAPLARRAEPFDMDWDEIENGHCLYTVRARVHEAMERAREKSRPSLLEIHTYRYRGHSVADANWKKYRPLSEIEDYRNTRDPIIWFRQHLIQEGVLTETQAEAIHDAAREEAEQSCNFAEQSPYPPKEEIFKDVYYELDNPSPERPQGKLFFND